MNGQPGETRRRFRTRALVALLILALAPAGAIAQAPSNAIPRVGIVLPGTPETAKRSLASYRAALRDLGYEESRNLALEVRYTEGKVDRAQPLVEDLVRRKVDVLVAEGYPLILAATRASTTIPIVGVSCGVELFARTLNRPGGNVSGVACTSPGLATKQLQMLREAMPDTARVGILYVTALPYTLIELGDLETAAQKMGVVVRRAPLSRAEDIEGAFARMQREQVQAVLTLWDPITHAQRSRIADLARERRLPTMSGLRDYCDEGGLLCYGTNHETLIRKGAGFVDRILKGARPADLPIEQPAELLLVVNAKTARSLGRTLPSPFLTRAEVIQ